MYFISCLLYPHPQLGDEKPRTLALYRKSISLILAIRAQVSTELSAFRSLLQRLRRLSYRPLTQETLGGLYLLNLALQSSYILTRRPVNQRRILSLIFSLWRLLSLRSSSFQLLRPRDRSTYSPFSSAAVLAATSLLPLFGRTFLLMRAFLILVTRCIPYQVWYWRTAPSRVIYISVIYASTSRTRISVALQAPRILRRQLFQITSSFYIYVFFAS